MSVIYSIVSDSSWLLCPWNFPGNNTGLGCHFLLQGIFPGPGIKPASPVFYFTKWIIRSFLTVAFTVPFVKKFIFDFLPEFSLNHCKQPCVSQGTTFFSPFPEEEDPQYYKDVLNQSTVPPTDISNPICRVQTWKGAVKNLWLWRELCGYCIYILSISLWLYHWNLREEWALKVSVGQGPKAAFPPWI